jgi:hypothetical protein
VQPHVGLRLKALPNVDDDELLIRPTHPEHGLNATVRHGQLFMKRRRDIPEDEDAAGIRPEDGRRQKCQPDESKQAPNH